MIVNPFHKSGNGFGILPISGEFFLGFFSPYGLVTHGHLSSCSTLGFGCSTCEVSQWWGGPIMPWENRIPLVGTPSGPYLARCIRSRRNRPSYPGMLLM
jgi:hypothetical protein